MTMTALDVLEAARREPWATQEYWPEHVVPGSDRTKGFGGSVDPKVDRQFYAAIIANCYEGRFLRAQQVAHAAAIVRAVNTFAQAREALRESESTLAAVTGLPYEHDTDTARRVSSAVALAHAGLAKVRAALAAMETQP